MPSDAKEIGKRIPESAWVTYEVGEDYRLQRAWLTEDTYIRRIQYLADDLLQKANKQEYDESRRFADREIGAIGTPVARVPLNVWFSELAEHHKRGDRDHLTHWLNSERARPFRTQKGRL